MAPDLEDRVPREILEALIQEGTEAFRKVLEKLLNLAMGLERSEFLGADTRERASDGATPTVTRTRRSPRVWESSD